MPTTTEWFGATVTNLGPLTTTFTPAASCATKIQDYALASTEGMLAGQPLILLQPTCGFHADEACVPSASAARDLYEDQIATRRLKGYYAFHSPGLYCPSGWETVGVAVSATETGTESISASGIFTVDWSAEGRKKPGFKSSPPGIAFMRALDPGETLVWCCPAEHTVDTRGQCTSSVSSFDPEEPGSITEYCHYLGGGKVETVTSFDGTTWTPALLSGDGTLTGTAVTTVVPVQTSDDDWNDTIVVHTAGVIALVHKKGDLEKEEDGDKNDNEDEGSNSDDEPDAAPSARALPLLSLGAVVVSLLAGIGMVAPW